MRSCRAILAREAACLLGEKCAVKEGVPMFVLSLLLAAAASNAVADTFLQRLSDNGFTPQSPPAVTVGALPPNWTPPVPLPRGVTVLGSVVKPKFSTEIYYEPADAAQTAQAYAAQLQAAGFAEHSPFFGPRGFVFGEMRHRLTILCRNRQSVSIVQNARDDLRVSISDPAAPGACAAPAPRVSTPVPQLVVPAGVTLLSGGGGEAQWSSAGDTTSYASATLQTPLSPKHVLAAFAAQMRAARWMPERAVVTPDTAVQSFTYRSGEVHWKASVVLVPDEKPKTYDVRFAASGSAQVAPSQTPIPPARPAMRLRSSDEPAVLELAQRIAGGFEPDGGAQVYLRTLPRSFDSSIPVPQGGLLGAVASADSTTLYYDLTAAQFDAYLANLRAHGWTAMPVAGAPQAGFVSAAAVRPTSYCKAGLPMLNVWVRPDANDVTMSVGASGVMRTCTFSALPAVAAPPPGVYAPLPDLHAPQGATMKPVPFSSSGRSSAAIVSARPIGDLFRDLAEQMTAAKWTAGSSSIGSALASQTFTYTESSGVAWQAVLTLSRSQADPHLYYGFISAERAADQ
jgi:hypothetical protein